MRKIDGPDQVNVVSGQIVDAAIKVHSALGPGLLESAYTTCLACALRKRGLSCERQVSVPIRHEEVELSVGYRIDLLVESCVVVELKAVTKLLRVHEAQLLSYLKLSGHKVGLLINFHSPLLKDGIERMIND